MILITRYKNKDIYYFAGSLAQLSSGIEDLPAPHFVCGFLLHQTDWSKAELEETVRHLLDRGCVYFLFHGNRCQEAHDVADETYYKTISAQQMTSHNVVLTTWHDDESEEAFIFNVLCVAWPAHDYEDTFSSCVLISIGTPAENNRVKRLLSNLETTLQQE
ncbi:MAG: hypothetical protein HY695_31540 [Deltaproteobacteria bacterium]|nr:hypothetical protein [Deltaproteobacteria bacterium]